MAKKQKDAASAGTKKPDDSASATEPVDVAYAMGNYAEVRKLAATSPHAAELMARVKIDPVQLLVGGVALLFITIVGLVVLK